MKTDKDVIIVGAGPAGLGCAIEGLKQQLEIEVFDQGNVVDALIRFPVNMTYFSTSDVLSLENIPMVSTGFRPTRVEAVKYYQNLVPIFNIPVRTHHRVTGIRRGKDGAFAVSWRHKDADGVTLSKFVILATGFYDCPNLLNIPGEDLPHVSHYYTEAFPYYRDRVVVVGGKNSAVETALDLFRSGADVTLVHRGPELRESIKYWILPDILNRIQSGQIRAFLNARVDRITHSTVYITQDGRKKKIPAEAVFLMSGYHPDENIYRMAGIDYDKQSLEPHITQDTLESSESNLYLAGSMIAGRNPNRIFIENARGHGRLIFLDIKKKLASQT